MTEQPNAREPERRTYVDRHRAREIQDDRLQDGTGRPDDRHSRTGPTDRGPFRRAIAWLRRAFGEGGTTGAAVALIALLAAACGSGAQPEAGDPSPSPAASETGEAMLSGSTTCEDPAGDVFATDPSSLPVDGDDPNVRAADLPNVSVKASRGGIALELRREDPGTPPTGEVQHTLFMRGEDGATGVIRATWFADPSSDAMDIEVGPGEDSLRPIDPTGTVVHSGQTVIPIPRDAMPIEPPFAWAAEVALLGSGVADVCPNVDPASPLASPDELPVFPTDDTVEVAGEPAIEVTGRNYVFEGVPEQAEAGTRLSFRNVAEEPHELVLLHLEDDAPPVEEFVQLPREEGEPHVQRLVGVSIAMPGQPGVMRQGELLLDQPGTYVALCGFPTGVSPEFIKENFDGPPEGPPPEEFGPPHVVQGMFAAIEVDG